MNVSEWLEYDIDSKGIATHLKCKVCAMLEDRIKDLPNFSDIFIKGSRNFKKSAVQDHAQRKAKDPKHPHSVAYKLYIESQGVGLADHSKIL